MHWWGYTKRAIGTQNAHTVFLVHIIDHPEVLPAEEDVIVELGPVGQGWTSLLSGQLMASESQLTHQARTGNAGQAVEPYYKLSLEGLT